MENTIPRETLLQLIEQQSGQPGARALVADVMADLGMDQQAHFTKADFVRVMDGVVRVGQQMVRDAAATEGADDTDRAHMAAMLQAVEDHAIPLLSKEGR